MLLGVCFQKQAWKRVLQSIMSKAFQEYVVPAIGFSFLITWNMGNRLFNDKWVLLFGSIGGSLCLSFSDSFWFSAVEAETYGPSMFCMIFLIWLAMKGSSSIGSERKNSLLRLSYIVGLAYCIHPMCILILPVCAFLWIAPDRDTSLKRAAITIALGVLYVLFISKVISVDLFEWAFQLDLLMVNNWSFPFYSGIFLLIILLGILAYFLWKIEKSRLPLMSIFMVVMGFTPYLMLFIRSSKLPAINEFTPNNLAKIKPYMNRESYPSRPLLYGPYFDAKVKSSTQKAKSYVKADSEYKAVGEIPEYHYEKDRMSILPRIYSNNPSHISTYRKWTGLSVGEKPRFYHNLKFMFKYQLSHMYWRYFMWNFSGRASDLQHTRWIGPWHGLAERSSSAYSKANNQYFMLPLIVGIVGFLYQAKRHKTGFVVLSTFFLITGFLLAIYLNATPNEPRERDYIYVGSYAAFTIWIGLGFMTISSFINAKKSKYLCGITSILVVGWMLYQNWDDHDRSNRTFHMEHARAVLDSCEKDGILFTGADNDTFPLWYLQEVEGFRTDVRVKVLSYFNADWYINQLSRPYYDSPPVQLTLKTGMNQYGPYNPPYIYEKTTSPIMWSRYMEALNNKNQSLVLESNDFSNYWLLPSRRINIETTKGILETNITGSYLQKNEMAILDIISSNDWERPIYFNFTSLNSLHIDLEKYVQQEGLVYRLIPEKNASEEISVDLDKTYHNLMKIKLDNLKDTRVYFNHEDFEMRTIVPIKFAFNELINRYLEKQDTNKVEELTMYVYENMYYDHLEPSYADLQLATFFGSLEKDDLASKLINRTHQFFYEKISRQLRLGETISRNNLIVLQEAIRMMQNPEEIEKYNQLMKKIGNLTS
ncbi:MAG: DUF2723 domain-containing protein [Bacteroidota bacterium]